MKIERLKIFTSHLQRQLQFYQNILGLEIIAKDEDHMEVKLGYSVIEIRQKENATPYHIAFHIPAYREEQALKWLKDRTSILKDGGKELVDFPNWNARSIYFYDADRNILEFISRRHCFPAEEEGFASRSVVGISEIGLATAEVGEVYDFLHSLFHLKKFTGDYEIFCAMGDDEGLFIVIDKEVKEWFPSGDRAYASEFELKFKAAGRTCLAAYKNERLELL